MKTVSLHLKSVQMIRLSFTALYSLALQYIVLVSGCQVTMKIVWFIYTGHAFTAIMLNCVCVCVCLKKRRKQRLCVPSHSHVLDDVPFPRTQKVVVRIDDK